VLKAGEQLLLVGPPREVIATFRANQQAAALSETGDRLGGAV
jgi:hypothetical protein